MEIQKEHKVDLTGVEQHGFKQAKSTASAGLIIHQLLAEHLTLEIFPLWPALT